MSLPQERPALPEDRRALRAADADREAVAEQLRTAAGDGRLTMEELDERLGLAYAAKTYGELELVVRDLPDTAPARSADAEPLTLTAPLGDIKRLGPWRVPSRIVAKAGAGTIKLDFTDAILSSTEVLIEARANAGDVVLLVPEGWDVRSSGAVKDRTEAWPRSGAPVLHVKGSVVLGEVIVRHPRRTRWLPR